MNAKKVQYVSQTDLLRVEGDLLEPGLIEFPPSKSQPMARVPSCLFCRRQSMRALWNRAQSSYLKVARVSNPAPINQEAISPVPRRMERGGSRLHYLRRASAIQTNVSSREFSCFFRGYSPTCSNPIAQPCETPQDGFRIEARWCHR